MKNKIVKLFILGSVITSFLFVLFFGFNVNAEEAPTTDETPTQEVVEEEVEVVEETPTKQEEEINGFIEYFKSWKVEDIKAWVILIASKLGVDAVSLLVLVIYIIRLRLKNIKEDEKYQALKTKLDVEHQKQVEDLMNEFNEKLAEIQASVIDTIKAQDEAKKEEIKGNIATLKNQLDNIKADIEK
jgi:hypothetical protein